MDKPNTKPYELPPNAVWLITGCSSGVGQALARLVAKNVTSESAIEAAVNQTLEKFGRLDVLVNNAGHGVLGEAEATSKDQARQVFETDFWGTVNLTLQALRVMREENPKTGPIGRLIMNITSIGGFIGLPGNAFYNASKFGVEGFTEAVSKELRSEWGVHLCLIEPGGIATGFAGSRLVQAAPHAAYAAPDSPCRAVESYILNPENQKTWATTESIAAATYHIAARGQKVPFRIPLGANTWQMVKDELNYVSQELEDVKEISQSISCAGNIKAPDYISKSY